MKAIYFEAFNQMPLKDIDHSSYGSDLYLRVTDTSTKLVEQYEYKNKVSTFRDQIEHELWYEIPFAFPYKIFEGQGEETKAWEFSHYDENENHVYSNGILNVGKMAQYHKEIVVTDFTKYRCVF